MYNDSQIRRLSDGFSGSQSLWPDHVILIRNYLYTFMVLY